MAKAVFTYSPASIYDDVPEERYHFPKQYLSRVQAAQGDWILYYEPGDRQRRSATARCYFAMARVTSVVPDVERVDHFYAYVRDYLEFPNPVSYRDDAGYFGAASPGVFRSAVRRIDDAEFERIVRFGLASILAARADTPGLTPPSLVDEPPEAEPRQIVQRLSSRPLRDAAFARQIVQVAYQGQCAITGLRITNGLGRAEVEAAHIRPVEYDGPDSPRNGMALSRTLHWMFDRGLISADDNGGILVAKGRVPDDALRLINPERHLLPPTDSRFKPHPKFLRYHRENVFKG
ncbi:MAG: restriction endonuclease [Betaproteobacteria bacterium]|nr:restriction endonuclease [Betaproteobacteria bacterium]